MPYLIPDDWDGVSTQSYKLIWPDSPQWLSILAGGLTGLLFPKNWDAGSGDVDDVLSDVQEIIDQNSVTGLLPGLDDDVIVQQVRACPLDPVQEWIEYNVPSAYETTLAYGWNLDFPSPRFLVQMMGTMTFKSSTNTVFTLSLREFGAGQLLARTAILAVDNANIYTPYVLSNAHEALYVIDDALIPYLTIQANNDNGTINFRATNTYKHTCIVHYEIGGGNFKLATE